MNRLLARLLGRMYAAPEGGGEAGGGGSGGGGAAGGGAASALSGEVDGGGGGQSNAGGGGQPQWYDSFKDAEVKTWIAAQNNGIPDAEAAARKAYNLEKLLGADKAGRALIPPKPDAKPEEWKAFWAKVGNAPEKPDGYMLPADMPKEVSEVLAKDPMLGKFREFAHQLGMPPQFFGQTLAWFYKQSQDHIAAQDAEYEQRATAEEEKIKTEWGKDFPRNVEFGRRAAARFVPHANPGELKTRMERIEGALGPELTYKLFFNIGKALGEHDFIDTNNQPGGGGLTKEAAQARIQALRGDPEWVKRWSAGGAAEKVELEKLQKIVYGGGEVT